jgi:hypothetical protein
MIIHVHRKSFLNSIIANLIEHAIVLKPPQMSAYGPVLQTEPGNMKKVTM